PESGHPLDEHRFPYVRKRGPIALIGVSTATATGPFMATGEVRRKQRKRLAAALQATRGAFRIVLIHHPPVSGATPWHKRLIKAGKIRAILEEHGAELVLHGHTHLPTRRLLTGPQGPIPVIGVAAAGEAPGSHRPPAQYNLFEISGEAGRWSCTLTAHVCEGPDLVAQRPVLPIYENGVCVAPDDAQDAPVEGPIVTQP
ncbi:MAG: metallophosphoesterase, partial [Hyphomicrobiaceae bacterium]|nr:metallophosphoesterase [Hyphomicrobiaceae bacterium]